MKNELTPIKVGGKNMRVKRSKATSKTPEGKVKDKIREMLDATPNCYWFFPVANGYNVSGIPDIIACVNGKFFGIEVKSNKTTHPVTRLQAKNLEMIRSAGGTALVIDENSLEDLKTILNIYSKGL